MLRGLLVGLTLGGLSLGLAAASDAPKARAKHRQTVIRLHGSDHPVAFLGVELGDGDDDDSDNGNGKGEQVKGVRVYHVVPDSPASRAGLEAGDVVIEFDGQAVEDPIALTREVHAQHPGDPVRIIVVRRGHKQSLEAELGSRGSDDEDSNDDLDDSIADSIGNAVDSAMGAVEGLGEVFDVDLDDHDHEADRPLLGVELVFTTPELSRFLGGEEADGLLVAKVMEGSAADKANVHVGDLIVSIDGSRTSGLGDLRKALTEKAGESVRLQVIREKLQKTLEVRLADKEPASD
jgi:serine protease Do